MYVVVVMSEVLAYHPELPDLTSKVGPRRNFYLMQVKSSTAQLEPSSSGLCSPHLTSRHTLSPPRSNPMYWSCKVKNGFAMGSGTLALVLNMKIGPIAHSTDFKVWNIIKIMISYWLGRPTEIRELAYAF